MSLAAVMSFALAAGCASPREPLITADDVRIASETGQLPALYERIATELQAIGLRESEREELNVRLEDAGRRLGALTESEIAASLSASRLPSGQVPLQTFGAFDARMNELARWSPATYARVAQDLEREKNTTSQAIAAKEAALGRLSKGQVAEKLVLFEELAALHGAGSPERAATMAKRSAVVAALRRDATAAIGNQEFGEAQRMLSILATVEPSDAAVVGELVEVDAKLFEQRFYEALEKGRPDEAYQAFVTLSEAKNFDKLRPRLADSSDAMTDPFIALAAGATESKNITDAFRWFGQACDIRVRLGLAMPQTIPEAAKFVAEIHRRYVAANELRRFGLAWGYLQVIASVSPVGPEQRRELRESHDEVMTEAIKRLSVAPFTNAQDSPGSYGSTLTAKLLQYLSEKSGDDVHIILREKPEASKAEIQLEDGKQQQISVDSFVDSLVDNLVDYLVEGNVLEAKVDSSERAGKKIVRVVVETETVPNPEWERWTAATDSQRKEQGLVRPSAMTITRQKKEDAEIWITSHRKVGVFSVSYRMIDATTAKVLFADTQRVKKEVEDTSSDGVSLGDFNQPFKVANLPTDIEILDRLAEDVSAAIGARLAGALAFPEVRYEENGDRFVREGNFVDASEQFAYATALSERKELDTTELRKKLYGAVVAAGID